MIHPRSAAPRRSTPLLLVLALLAAGCGAKGLGAAAGSDGEIAFVAGEGVPEAAALAVEKALSREVRYAQPEPLFHVVKIPAAGLDDARRRANVILLTNLTVPGKVARAARDILTAEQAGNASTHHGSILTFEDVWARGQSVVIVAAPDAEGVLELAEERSERIADVAATAAKTRIADALYRGGEDTEASKRLAEGAGWSLRIPRSGWRVDETHRAEGFVRLVAQKPERRIVVAWVPGRGAPPDEAGALALLDSLASRFEGGEGFAPGATIVAGESFLGRPSVRVSGGAGRAGSAGAGAAAARVFEDPAGGRLYAVAWRTAGASGALRTWMWEMEALAGTFRTVSEGNAGPR